MKCGKNSRWSQKSILSPQKRELFIMAQYSLSETLTKRKATVNDGMIYFAFTTPILTNSTLFAPLERHLTLFPSGVDQIDEGGATARRLGGGGDEDHLKFFHSLIL